MVTRIILIAAAALAIGACNKDTNPAATRQAEATRQLTDQADRMVGMPRITRYTQRRQLKNAYEDMDAVVLTYAYSQDLSGKYVCLGQALGYGIPFAAQFTAPTYPQRIRTPGTGTDSINIYEQAQPEPNGLYMPDQASATVLRLIDSVTGQAKTALIEQDILTVPFQLPPQAVSAPCPAPVDPRRVVEVDAAGKRVVEEAPRPAPPTNQAQ
jgi:hypothetical protein